MGDINFYFDDPDFSFVHGSFVEDRETLFRNFTMEEYERQIEEQARLDEYNPEQDDLCLMLDFYESQIEKQVMNMNPLPKEEEFAQKESPERFFPHPSKSSENSPNLSPEWLPPPPWDFYKSLFGRLRASSSGIRSRSAGDELWCPKDQRYVTPKDCSESSCPYWDKDYSQCSFTEEEEDDGENEQY